MGIFVTGATGSLGRAFVAALRAREMPFRVLTRSVDRAKARHPGLLDGVPCVEGGLESLGAGHLRGTRSLVLILPMAAIGRGEQELGQRAIAAAEEAGVEYLQFVSAYYQTSRFGVVRRPLHRALLRILPRLEGKLAVEESLRRSRLRFTVVQPTCFMQVDEWFRQYMEQEGVYGWPVGFRRPVNRVDVRDVADAMVGLLRSVEPQQFCRLAGPENVTGEASCQVWSKYLGRPVHYWPGSLASWADRNKELKVHEPHEVDYMHDLLHVFNRFGAWVPPWDRRASAAAVGHPLRTYEDFVREVGSSPAGK